MPPHPLTNFEIRKYYQNEPNFNGVYSRNNLPKIKDIAYVINLDEYELVGTCWLARYLNVDNVTFFDSFGVEYIQKDIKKFIGKNNIMTNIHTTQSNDSIRCGYVALVILILW